MLGGTAQGQGQLAYAPGRITYKTGRRRKNGFRGVSAAFCWQIPPSALSHWHWRYVR